LAPVQPQNQTKQAAVSRAGRDRLAVSCSDKTRAVIMVSDDPNVPAEQNQLRRCEKCNATMKQLGELPALSIHTAVRIFRCYACDHVVTERS
jgi:hypothetical protein